MSEYDESISFEFTFEPKQYFYGDYSGKYTLIWERGLFLTICLAIYEKNFSQVHTIKVAKINIKCLSTSLCHKVIFLPSNEFSNRINQQNIILKKLVESTSFETQKHI